MDKELYKYFLKKMYQSDIRVIHQEYANANFKTKEEIDKFFEIMERTFDDFFDDKDNKKEN